VELSRPTTATAISELSAERLLDAVVAGYIAEAVDAWKAGLHRASAVMTGVWRNDQGLSVTTGSANRSLNAHDAWVMPCSEE